MQVVPDPIQNTAQHTPPQSGGTVIELGKEYSDIPFPQIEELAGLHTRVPVRVQRRNLKGQLSTMNTGGMLVVETAELANIESWSSQQWGGGNYRCEVKDPANHMRVLFTFRYNVEGPAKQSTGTMPSPNAPAPGGSDVSNPYSPFGAAIPAGTPTAAHRWAQGLPPEERAAYYASQGLHLQAPTSSIPSDALAMRQNEETKVQLARMQEKFERAEAERKAEVDRLKKEAEEAKAAAKEAEHRAELKALEARLEAMAQAQQLANQQPKGPSLIESLAPLVPLGIAYLKSAAEERQATLQAQTQGFQAMIAAATPRQQPDGLKETLATLGPLVSPLLAKALDKGSDNESNAKLFNSLMESQIQSVSMMAQLVAETAPPPETPVGRAISQGLETLQRMGQAYIASQVAGPKPAGVLRGAGGPAITPGGSYQTMDESEVVPGAEVPKDAKDAGGGGKAPQPAPPPPEIEALFGMLPQDFQSTEWKMILFHLHTEPPMEVKRIATMLAGQLEHLISFGLVPELLSGITSKPRETLESMLEKLPVAGKHPKYAAEVLDTTLEFLRADNYVPQAEGGGAAGDGEDDAAEDSAAEE